MSEVVALLLRVHVEREEFAEVVIALGGVGPDRWNDATLARDERAVWVFVDPDEEPKPEPEEMLLAEERLGGPVASQVFLDYSTALEGSDWLALEIIEAAAKRWPLLVDTLRGGRPASEGLFTAEELRARVLGKRYVFSEEVPPGAPAGGVRSRGDGADA